MPWDFTLELIDRAVTENERGLVKCLLNCNMMLETYITETDNPQKILLLRSQIELNTNTILIALDLI